MLLHDNPFWRFSLSLYQLKRIKDACLQLQDESGANVNLLLFALWVSQQQLRFAPDWKQSFQQLDNWHRDYTLQLRRQRNELKVLAEKADQHEDGPLHRMRDHIMKAELLAEQQEQAVLYYYYQERQGLLDCENKEAALIENLCNCFEDPTQVDDAPLKVLLGVLLDERDTEFAIVRLREQLERRHQRR
ncbi:TIGR02444 family protein [Marinospirillum alkaliphilum]|uniref:TIGR02444 family protein n=1 Tax=Marinospirillum alkaliphilum DSM 21637 TaxID=1122209 RepID=A0A1K1Y6Z9_9GAMM|nr:TIGR02444 family protein [Marinospirillum alkaliphilum]SFX57004.1 TIGR02444 family protein [Marinospirillum alkaliphilum DSM 21637]